MYKVVFAKTAEKELFKIPDLEISRILQKIEKLPENPFPVGVVKIKAKEDLWRIRAGNYRIIYTLNKEVLIIRVLRIRHRKDAYKP
jgi:mRNA interferase RelE/StbE